MSEALELLPPGDGRPLWDCFDAEWYAAAHPGVPEAEAREYYLAQGAARGHAPNRWFDEGWYRLRNPDVAAAIAEGRLRSGFEHYLRDGFRGRAAHWLFDEGLYLAGGAVEAAADCGNAYGHFLRHGARAGRAAHWLFDAATYRMALADEPGAAAAIDAMGAWHHYLARAWFERRDAVTSVWFDPDWYVARHPAAVQRLRRGISVSALHDYLTAGVAAGASPLPQFDEAFYLATTAEAADGVRAGRFASGYEHFLRVGAAGLRNPAPHVDLRRYRDETPAARVAVARGTVRNAFAHLLLSGAVAPLPDAPQVGPVPLVGGHVDSHGFAAVAGGWVFLGWLPAGALPGADEVTAVARFGEGERAGTASLVRFARADLPDDGTGVLVFLPGGEGAATGGLVELDLMEGGRLARLPARIDVAAVEPKALVAQATASIAGVPATPVVARLRVLLGRQPYAGAGTLGALQDPVFFQIDETIRCPQPEGLAGLAFNGWMLAAPGVVAEVRLHCGGRSAAVALDHVPRPPRPDALEGVGTAHGLSELNSGFLAYVPDIMAEGEVPYIAITTARGEIGYQKVPAPRLRGMEAMQYLLARAEPRYGEVVPAFEQVFGPAIARLNAERLRPAPEFRAIDFGQAPGLPRISVIVTLHRRLDFMEYQMAFFSRHAGPPYELIYVLDDPPRARQAEVLAASCFARFAVPFRLVMLSHNLGFGPANNLGLALARAPYVCFLNSDVFPGTPDWMERLVARLRDTPELGAVGPLLLYEDGCVQHQGMRFETLEAFGGFHFPMHPGKGWRPVAHEGLRRADAITGACIVMAKWLAQEMGGFDPAYPVGDFEDSDLCLRLRLRGLEVAVDMGVQLYHLERQSQTGSEKPWRMNMTVFNAWLHDQRWRDVLEALPAPNDDDFAGDAP